MQSFLLPMQRRDINSADGHSKNLRPKNSGKVVVLIAEDEALIRNVARLVLESDGYFVLTADDGHEALEISQTFPGTIDVLLSDIIMPRIDGLELREQILATRPETKIILMSGQVDGPTGDVPFLRKPFTADLLRTSVRQLLTPVASTEV